MRYLVDARGDENSPEKQASAKRKISAEAGFHFILSQYRRRRVPEHQLRRRDCGQQRGCAHERQRRREGKPVNGIDESPSERLFVYHENQQN
jgi:hypothetical protein